MEKISVDTNLKFLYGRFMSIQMNHYRIHIKSVTLLLMNKSVYENSDLTAAMAFYQERTDRCLQQLLPTTTVVPEKLHEAMHYAVFAGGKRVRPLLVYLTGRIFDVELEILDRPAAALELIHTYSLVHDDLPAMDDDDLRRGKPTCHKVYGEAIAILTGDALQTHAFEVLCDDNHAISKHPQHAGIVAELARASGSTGMAGGQAIDLLAAGSPLALAELQTLHRMKTGALIRASVVMGALCADNATKTQITALSRYAECIGLSFQIQDDILDVIGDTQTLGKPAGSDEEKDKPTYTSLLGLEGARQKAWETHEQALKHLEDFDSAADTLRALSEYIVSRAS